MEDELKNVVEQRQVVSVLSDMAFKLKKFFARKTMFTDTNIADITDGKAFVIGQLVSVVVKDDYGSNPPYAFDAIVIGISCYDGELTDATYVLRALTDNMDTPQYLVNTIYTNSGYKITPGVNTNIIDTIIKNIFGYVSAFDFLGGLDIPHIFILEDGAFKSYM